MKSRHPQPINTHHSHEYTACARNQCVRISTLIHTACSLLFGVRSSAFDTVGKSSMGVSIGILNSTKCTSHRVAQ